MTAHGSLNGIGPNFHGTFVAEGFRIQVSGLLFQPAHSFQAPSVALTYESLEDLQGSYNIAHDATSSYIGTSDLSLNLKNEQDRAASISGPLLEPTDEKQAVSGVIHFERV